MTRETKIGLLVGLAFIIVIGILLTDHLSSSTEGLPAPLPTVGSNVRSTILSPGSSQAPITAVVQAPQVQPVAPVPTQRELQAPTPASEVVKVGGPSIQTQSQPAVSSPNAIAAAPVAYVSSPEPSRQPPQVEPQQQAAPQPPIRVTQTPQVEMQSYGADAPDSAIARIAAQHGVEVVSMNNSKGTAQNGAGGGMKEYTAEPGDSLSKIAQKFLGSGGKAARDSIVKANPSLQDNPDLIVAGRTYKIPAAIASAPAQQPQPQSREIVSVPPAQPAGARTASSAENWYTVQPGDTLWKIATEQLGTPSAVNAIKELNKETLRGGDTITANMKLRLPGKPMAQAN
jgi:nucleoid-associated protein YgaU